MSKIALSPNASGTGVFTIASPSGNTDRTLTLPDEAGTVLTNSSDIPAANLTGSLPAGMGGKVLQVVSVANTGTGSGTSNTFLDIVTGVTITPTSSTSKILLLGMTTLTFLTGDEWFTKVQVSVGGGAYSDVGSNSFGLMPANSAGYTATGVGWQILTVPIHFLYSPATTSELTFKTLATGQNGGGTTFYYNRTGNSSGTDSGSAISVLTAMEIAA